jgi:uncharacterized protein (TIGR03437 family)
VKDGLGTERLAPLFFVSPSQVNYQVPPGTAGEAATIIVSNEAGANFTETVCREAVAPGLFSANADGQGVPAAYVLRVKPNGVRSTEQVSVLDQTQNRFVPVPIDLGPEGDQVFLVLFGTGIRGRSGLSVVRCTIGGVAVPIGFAGATPDFIGLDQVNIGPLPRALAGSGEVDVVLTVDNKEANVVRVAIR